MKNWSPSLVKNLPPTASIVGSAYDAAALESASNVEDRMAMD